MKKRKPPTDKQLNAARVNWLIGSFSGLGFQLRKAGYYDFEQRVRELEEQFRHHTGRKEKK